MPRKRRLPPNVRAHGSGFRAVVSIDGRRERSPVMDTVQQVEVWLAQFRAATAKPREQPLHLTLADGLRLIEQDLADSGARPPTVAFYRNHARILFVGLGGDEVRLHSITTQDLGGYLMRRRAAGVSVATIVTKELFVLRRMRKLALQAGFILPADPFDGLKLPKFRTGRFDVLTRERIAELVAAMRADRRGKGPWHADIVELLFATGMRRAELCRLRVNDIDFAARRISVDGKTAHRYQQFGAPLEPVLRRLIDKATKDDKLVSSERTVEKLFERWQKRLGEPRFSAHVMRHSYATDLAGRVSPFDLMALMGHASLTQTSRYFHARGDAVRAALDSLQLGPQVPEPKESAEPPPVPKHASRSAKQGSRTSPPATRHDEASSSSDQTGQPA